MFTIFSMFISFVLIMFVSILIGVLWLMSVSSSGHYTVLSSYECGFLSKANFHKSFNIQIFLLMIVFMCFDLELVFMTLLFYFSNMVLVISFLLFMFGTLLVEWWLGSILWKL